MVIAFAKASAIGQPAAVICLLSGAHYVSCPRLAARDSAGGTYEP